jgi:hypothetical protein
VERLNNSVNKCKENWNNHVQRMTGNGIPRQMVEYEFQRIRSRWLLGIRWQNQIRGAAPVLGVMFDLEEEEEQALIIASTISMGSLYLGDKSWESYSCR